MSHFSCTVSIHKKNLDLFPSRLSVYRQYKIIQATDHSQKSYYLFFFKDTFLHAVQLDEVPTPSFLDRILSDGISFPGAHPLTKALVEANHPLHSTKLSLLFKKAQEKQSPMSVTLLLAFFDACIPAETIHKQFRKTFYYYRRNGQLLAAYQLLNFYKDFDPEDSFAADMLNNLSFNRYEKRYQSFTDLDEQNPAYLELLCFDHLEKQECFDRLLEIYQEGNRWIDALAVRCERLKREKSDENIKAIYALAAQRLNSSQQTLLFHYLLSSVPDSAALRTDVFRRILPHGSSEDIILFLLREPVEVNKTDLPLVTQHFLAVDPTAFLSSPDKLSEVLLNLYQDDHHTLEKISIRSVSAMMEGYDLPFIKSWLNAFSQAGISLPVRNKLEKMERLEEDPDQQFALGELYLYFHQYHKSIDCFKWEMELNPDDPAPIQYLSKAYQALGEKEEAKAYTMLLGQLGKKQV